MRDELVGLELEASLAVPVVAAAARLHVDDAARGAAIFGFVARALDLDFADEVERHVLGRSEGAVLNARHFDAVDDEHVLGARGAVDREARALVLLANARRDIDDRREIQRLRNECKLFSIDVCRHLVRRDVDDGFVARRHGDGLTGHSRRQFEIHRECLAEFDGHILADLRAEAGRRNLDLVHARSDTQEFVPAVAVGCGRERPLRGDELDGRTRDCRTLNVVDLTLDAARDFLSESWYGTEGQKADGEHRKR